MNADFLESLNTRSEDSNRGSKRLPAGLTQIGPIPLFVTLAVFAGTQPGSASLLTVVKKALAHVHAGYCLSLIVISIRRTICVSADMVELFVRQATILLLSRIICTSPKFRKGQRRPSANMVLLSLIKVHL
jgi:hypothetical protein